MHEWAIAGPLIMSLGSIVSIVAFLKFLSL